MFESNGHIIIRQLGNNTKVLVIDPETGLVMDLMNGTNTCGSYCYKSQQTEWACNLTESIYKNGQTILDLLIKGNGTIDFNQLANNIKSGLMGFLNSAMISLEVSNMFLTNSLSEFTQFYSDGVKVNFNFNNFLVAAQYDITIGLLAVGGPDVLAGESAVEFLAGLITTGIGLYRGDFSEMRENHWLEIKLYGTTLYSRHAVVFETPEASLLPEKRRVNNTNTTNRFLSVYFI
ncbi:MAG: hypothetical protein HVN35_03345 [Methanobacteriaceae archaeon]|nr:hypothetical protein [Methanobacteriaceae archaeon]